MRIATWPFWTTTVQADADDDIPTRQAQYRMSYRPTTTYSYTLAPHAPGTKPAWMDFHVVAGKDRHTVRLYRRGPITIRACTAGTIGAQDMMYALSREVPCPQCMALVANLRAHGTGYWRMGEGGAGDGLAVMGLLGRGGTDRIRSARHDVRRDLMEERYWTAAQLTARTSIPYKAVLYARIQVHGEDVAAGCPYIRDALVRVNMADRYSTYADCEKRAFRKTRKDLTLRVMPRWWKWFKLGMAKLDGMFIGDILRMDSTKLTALAFRVRTPYRNSGWDTAYFARACDDDGTAYWKFTHWARAPRQTT